MPSNRPNVARLLDERRLQDITDVRRRVRRVRRRNNKSQERSLPAFPWLRVQLSTRKRRNKKRNQIGRKGAVASFVGLAFLGYAEGRRRGLAGRGRRRIHDAGGRDVAPDPVPAVPAEPAAGGVVVRVGPGAPAVGGRRSAAERGLRDGLLPDDVGRAMRRSTERLPGGQTFCVSRPPGAKKQPS